MIDAHVHLFPQSVAADGDFYTDDPGFAMLYRSPKAKIADADILHDYVSRFSLNKIFALGFSWQSRRRCDEHNEALLRARSEIVIPFASVPGRPVSDVEAMCDLIKKKGFAGIGEVSFYSEGLSEANARYLSEIFRACEKFGLLVFLHVNEPVGHDYPGKYSPEFEKLYRIISENPGTRVVLSHFGGGIFLFESMPEVRERFQNVYYDTAASPFIYDETIFKMARAAGVLEKLLFGTDFPLMNPEKFYPLFERAGLCQEEIELITVKNPERFLDSYPEIPRR